MTAHDSDACVLWNYVQRPKTLDELFEMTYQEPMTGCWLWPYSGDSAPSRGIWEKLFGKIKSPPGKLNKLFVLHTCDMRWCVNPGHLYLGTRRQNTIDANERGRFARGERSGRAKLRNVQAAAIYFDRATSREVLASVYGVSEDAIRNIQRGARYCTFDRSVFVGHAPDVLEKIALAEWRTA